MEIAGLILQPGIEELRLRLSFLVRPLADQKIRDYPVTSCAELQASKAIGAGGDKTWGAQPEAHNMRIKTELNQSFINLTLKHTNGNADWRMGLVKKKFFGFCHFGKANWQATGRHSKRMTASELYFYLYFIPRSLRTCDRLF